MTLKNRQPYSVILELLHGERIQLAARGAQTIDDHHFQSEDIQRRFRAKEIYVLPEPAPSQKTTEAES